MRTIITYFLLIIISISCAESADNQSEVEEVPGHEIYPSGWETENLKGKIKSLKQYKASVINIKTGITDEPILEFIKTYNRYGNTVKEEHFGPFGELEQSFEGVYSNDGTYSRTIWTTIGIDYKAIILEKFDTTTGRVVSSEYIINDSIQDGISYSYDKNGNFKEIKPLSGEFSQHIIYEYEYDENERVLSEIEFTINDGQVDTLCAYSYQYDTLGNKTEQFNKSTVDFVKDTRTVFEYDEKKRLTKLTRYEKDLITEIIEYDSLGNLKTQTEYQEGVFANQMQYLYDYDKQGNWIKQRVFLAEKDYEDRELFVKTRKIEYFK